MRVQSITEVNTHQQQNPFLLQKAGFSPAGKTVSGLSFEEYFRMYSLQKSAARAPRQPEYQATGLFWGYYPSLKIHPKPEQTLEANA